MKHRQENKYKYLVYLRRSVRLFVFAFLLLIPLSNQYANYKIAYNNARLVQLANQHNWDGGYLITSSYKALNWLHSLSDDPVTSATANNGTFWAITVFGMEYSDPIGVISSLINGHLFAWKYFLGAILPLIVALLFGRVFCSWICPMSLVFALSRKIRKRLDAFNVPLFNLSLPRRTAGFIMLFGFITSYTWGMWVWHLLLPYISLGHEIFSGIIFGSTSFAIYYLVALVALDIAILPGEFCRSLCPTGFLLAYFQKRSFIQVSNKENICQEKCSQCIKACPLGCSPKLNNFSGCSNCALCLQSCPADKLAYRTNKIKQLLTP